MNLVRPQGGARHDMVEAGRQKRSFFMSIWCSTMKVMAPPKRKINFSSYKAILHFCEKYLTG